MWDLFQPGAVQLEVSDKGNKSTHSLGQVTHTDFMKGSKCIWFTALMCHSTVNSGERYCLFLLRLLFHDVLFGVPANWVKLEYREGDNYHSHCGSEGRRTVVLIICDPARTQVCGGSGNSIRLPVVRNSHAHSLKPHQHCASTGGYGYYI